MRVLAQPGLEGGDALLEQRLTRLIVEYWMAVVI